MSAGIRKIAERPEGNGLTISLPGQRGIWKLSGAWLWLVGVSLILAVVFVGGVWAHYWAEVSKYSIDHGGTYVRVRGITESRGPHGRTNITANVSGQILELDAADIVKGVRQ